MTLAFLLSLFPVLSPTYPQILLNSLSPIFHLSFISNSPQSPTPTTFLFTILKTTFGHQCSTFWLCKSLLASRTSLRQAGFSTTDGSPLAPLFCLPCRLTQPTKPELLWAPPHPSSLPQFISLPLRYLRGQLHLPSVSTTAAHPHPSATAS